MKRLWLTTIKTNKGNVKIWVLRDYDKAFPVQEYFWNNPDWLWRDGNYVDA